MYYIVGLGNPGEKYTNTRHNVGWTFLDYFIEKEGLPKPFDSAKYSGFVSEGMINGQEIMVLKPNTFMNLSGSAVCKLVPNESINHLIIVYDDIDISIGDMKISVGRGAGGHNGVASVIESLGSRDFIRVRIGIAPVNFWTGKAKRPAAASLSRHVISKFTAREEKKLEAVKENVRQALITIVSDGVEAAMNKYN